MRRLTKSIISILIVSILLLAVPLVVLAADGSIRAADTQGEVGAEFPVTITVSAGDQPIGDIDIEFDYTSAVISFVSGENATAGTGDIPGRFHITATGDGTQTEMTFRIMFHGESEGSSNIAARSLDQLVATTSDGTAINLVGPDGNALSTESVLGTITVGPPGSMPMDGGDTPPASTNEPATVTMQGTNYTILEDFADSAIPTGFSRTTVNLQGADRNAIIQDASGTIMMFLVVGGNDPVLGLYNEADQSFSSVERVRLSDTLDLFVLATNDGRTMPTYLTQTTIDLNGTIFPAWQNTNDSTFFVVYALSGSGNRGYYQYDTLDRTFQRYSIPEDTTDAPAAPAEGLLGRITSLIEAHLVLFLLAGFLLFLLLLIIIIILGLKLSKRNTELEDVYDSNYEDEYDDEYDSDYDDEYDDDDYDSDYDDEYDDDSDYDDAYDDEYDDDYEDDIEDEYEGTFEDDYDAEEDEVYAIDPYDDDIFVDDDDEPEYHSKSKVTDDIDFIDL